MSLGLLSPAYAQDAITEPPFAPMVCEKRANVDTCWKEGIDFDKTDPAKALFYYELSCDFGHQTGGCYNGGKIYLHNKKLRDYAKAYLRFERVCTSGDIGQGPYACKFLGWMHMTGIGARKSNNQAAHFLSRACFRHNDLTTDAEGCMLLGDGFLKGWFNSIITDATEIRKSERRTYLAYLAYSRACLDHAEDMCAKAKTLYAEGRAKGALWMDACENYASTPEGYKCTDFSVSGQGYELSLEYEYYLAALFSKLTKFR